MLNRTRITDIALTAAVSAVVTLAIVLAAMFLFHKPSTQDLSGALVAFGGLMGVVFTIAGLVVALAAVLTVITIEDRVKRTFNDQLPDLQKRADKQIEGYITLLRAENAPDWTTAELLTQEALNIYPALPRARSALGLRLADEVIDRFALEHGVSKPYEVLDPLAIGRPPLDRAITWLERALDHHDDPEDQTTAALALMYGASRQHDHMLRLVRSVSGASASPAHLTMLRDPPHLAMLVHACGVDEQRLHELGETLKTPLPIPSRDVLTSIESLDLANASAAASLSPCVDCLVMGRLSAWRSPDMDWFPLVVRIFVTADAHNQRQAQLALPGGVLQEHTDLFTHPMARPAKDVLADLEAVFLFVCQTPRS